MLKIRYDIEPVMVRIGKNKVMLLQDWCFFINDVPYWIPAGYFYNGASIPRVFWIVVGAPFEPQFWAAALAHDWIYLTHILGRVIADEVIFQLCIQAEVELWRARCIWAAVRSCGQVPWINNEQDKKDLLEVKTKVLAREDAAKFRLNQCVA